MRKLIPTGAEVRSAISSKMPWSPSVGTPAPPTMPRAPALETAAARSALATPPIPACWSGRAHPTTSVNLVLGMSVLLWSGDNDPPAPGRGRVRPDRGRLPRGRRPLRPRHGAGRPLAPQRPHRVARPVRILYRHVD